MTKEEIIEAIENMTVLELSELVKALEEKFGVSAAAPVMMGAMPAGAQAQEAAPAEEKTEFDVVITEFAANKKIPVIKAVRALKPELGLKDAKEVVENLPAKILEAVPKEIAEDAKAKLEEAGATVELK